MCANTCVCCSRSKRKSYLGTKEKPLEAVGLRHQSRVGHVGHEPRMQGQVLPRLSSWTGSAARALTPWEKGGSPGIQGRPWTVSSPEASMALCALGSHRDAPNAPRTQSILQQCRLETPVSRECLCKVALLNEITGCCPSAPSWPCWPRM